MTYSQVSQSFVGVGRLAVFALINFRHFLAGRAMVTFRFCAGTPLQKVSLALLPHAEQTTKYSYSMACSKPILGSSPSTCETLFAVSFLSSVAEWILYMLLAIRIIHKFVIKPLLYRVVKFALIISIMLFASKLLEQYASLVLPAHHALTVRNFAMGTSTLVAELLAFAIGGSLQLYREVSAIVAADAVPGASLYRSGAVALLWGSNAATALRASLGF